ncbi:uncharacterized protein TM35_000035190 [Trypanosoma theileri]|uniref:Uncharacterized protein n=1 Tax=Trypanosoma theileri TaxID=67003 RepID=A0A1X0P739_9TRYP|nr:uncharacterized protein TM35_000035190 [Trypanosoma theileri]ORC92766.1 hypothetical protein TM35_000035190 [Trypanosoma theileri]
MGQIWLDWVPFMSVEVIIDYACEGLFCAVSRAVSLERSGGQTFGVREEHNVVSSSVIVKKNEKPYLVLYFINCSDFLLLLRQDCARDYFNAMYQAMGCPLYVVMLDHPTGPRQSRFWEGVAQLCAESSLSSFLVGFDFAPFLERAADIVVSHGFKACRQQTECDPLARTDGRRKCDPTDFHALYLDMLVEISHVSDRRAAVIAGVFPSMCHLLKFIDSGTCNRLSVEEYGEDRASSAFDPYIIEVLSTDYNTREAQDNLRLLNEKSKNLFT